MARSVFGTALAVAAAAALTMAAVAAPAHADLGLGDPPATLSAGVNAFSPQIAIASDGTIIATWWANTGSNYVVQAARSVDAGVTWDAAVTLSSPFGYALLPQVAATDDGTIAVAWIASGGAYSFVQVATSTDSGVTWNTHPNLSGIIYDARNPQVFAAADGSLAVSWERDLGSGWIVQATRSTDAGVSWAAPSSVSVGGGNAQSHELVVAADGTMVATWIFNAGSGGVVQTSSSTDGGGTWSAPVDLSATGGDAYNPRLAVSPDGTITAAWQRYGAVSSVIQTSRTTDGGISWSVPFDLSVDGVNSYNARIAVAGNGTIVVTWERGNGSVERLVQAATSTNGGVTWSAPATLSALGVYSDLPQIVVDGSGSFTVTWERDIAAGSVIEVATLAGAGATWTEPLQVSTAVGFVYEAQLAVAADGAVTVVWQFDDSSSNVVQARTLRVLAAAVDPALAATGVNLVPLGLAGALALVLGAAMVHWRERA